MIEQLTEKNLIKDFFEELSGGRPRGDLEGRAARLGCDLDQAHVVVVAEPADDSLERALRNAAPGSLFDRREDSLRALLKLPTPSAEALLARVRRIQTDLPTPVSIGVSSVCKGEPSFADGFAEAQQALLGTKVLKGQPAVLAYEELGAYKYLLRVAMDGGIRDATVDAYRSSPSTTRSAAPSSLRRSRSSCAATGTSARPRRRSTSTRTRSDSGSAASPSSRGSTSAATTG